MTQANVANYRLAQEKVATGRWNVDLDGGHVIGVGGQPFRRTNSWGYIQIKFRDADDYTQEHAVLAHRVIWESAHGELPPGLAINHRNGDKTDNRLANLEAVTASENMLHAVRTGLLVPLRGEAKPNAKLDADAVRQIRRLLAAGHSQHSITDAFGVHRSVIKDIKAGVTWRSVA